jgi:LysR family transcriptional regulator, regulator for metE and metH
MSKLHLELRHLRAVRAIAEAGSFAGAAEQMHLTQSALSHMIKGIEDRVGMALFSRRSRPLRLSAAGERLRALAERVLPEIDAFEAEIDGLHSGRGGRLFIAMECHACYDWMIPVLDRFRRAWPAVDIDIRAGAGFSALGALDRDEVDLVLTSDPEAGAGRAFAPLFDYEPVAVAAESHPFAAKPFVTATDFAAETLIAYPVDRSRLDVFVALLAPAGVEPRGIRRTELTQMILLLAAGGHGVAVLPDWVLRSGPAPRGLIARRLTEAGVTRRMFAATRAADRALPFMAHALRLMRGPPGTAWQRGAGNL